MRYFQKRGIFVVIMMVFVLVFMSSCDFLGEEEESFDDVQVTYEKVETTNIEIMNVKRSEINFDVEGLEEGEIIFSSDSMTPLPEDEVFTDGRVNIKNLYTDLKSDSIVATIKNRRGDEVKSITVDLDAKDEIRSELQKHYSEAEAGELDFFGFFVDSFAVYNEHIWSYISAPYIGRDYSDNDRRDLLEELDQNQENSYVRISDKYASWENYKEETVEALQESREESFFVDKNIEIFHHAAEEECFDREGNSVECPGEEPFEPEIHLVGSPGSEEAYLHWDHVEEADEYNVYRSSRKSGPFQEVTPEVSKRDNSYTVDNLNNNEEYYFKVTAEKNHVESPPSNIVSLVPEARKKVEMHEDLIILGSSDLEKTEIISEDRFEFDKDLEATRDIRAGDYLSFPRTDKTEHLLFQQVTDVVEGQDLYTVHTENARLQDVVDEARVSSRTSSESARIKHEDMKLAEGVSFEEFPSDYDLGGSLSIEEIPLLEYNGETLVHMNGETEVKFDLEREIDINLIGEDSFLIKPSVEIQKGVEVWLSALDITNTSEITSFEKEVGSIPIEHPIPVGPVVIPSSTDVPIYFEISLEKFETAFVSPLAYFASTLKSTGGVSYNMDIEDETAQIGNWRLGGNVNLKHEFGFPMFQFGSLYEFDWSERELEKRQEAFALEKALKIQARPTLRIARQRGPFLGPYADLAQFDFTISNFADHLWNFQAPGGNVGLEVGTETGGLNEIIDDVPEDFSEDIEGDVGGLIPQLEVSSVKPPENIEVQKDEGNLEISWDEVEAEGAVNEVGGYRVYKNPLVSLPGLRGTELGETASTSYSVEKSSISEGTHEIGVMTLGEIFGVMEYGSLISDKEEVTLGEEEEYELKIEVDGKGYTEPEAGSYSLEAGEIVELKAVPEEGWIFKEWIGNVDDTTSQETSIEMDRDQNVTAVFTEDEEFTLEVEKDGEGSVNIDPEKEKYDKGEEVKLKAEPESGWTFTGWDGNVLDPESRETTVIMEDDRYITANFERINYEGSIKIDGEAPGENIKVRITDPTGEILEIVETDFQGDYSLSAESLEEGQEISVEIRTMDTFTEDHVRDEGLLTWIMIDDFLVEEGENQLPELDLYGYGLDLIEPASEEVVESFPYEVKIEEYDRNVPELLYFLMFNNFQGEFIGQSADPFYDATWYFDGILMDGSSLSQHAIWFVVAAYRVDDYYIQLNTWGNQVYWQEAPSEAKEAAKEYRDIPAERPDIP